MPPRSTPGRTATARALATVGAVGPVLYVLLTVVLGLLRAGYDPIRDTQSELGAVDAPLGIVMNVAGFMTLGASMLAFAGAYALLLRPGWATRVATALLVLAGVGMVVVGFFPCDAGCVDVTGTGRMHSLFSAPGAIGLSGAAMVSSLVFHLDGRFGPAWQRVSMVLGVLTLASGPLVALGVAAGSDGLLQRVGMWPALFWMAAVSWRLRSLGPWADTPSDDADAGEMRVR